MFTRTDNSFLGSWWWSIDRNLFWAIIALSIVGLYLVFSASTSVADRININTYTFFIKQSKYMLLSISLMILVSFFSVKTIRKLSIISIIPIILILIATLNFGLEIKGATRWLHTLGFTIQVSEFSKPAFAIVSAALFSTHFEKKNIPGIWIATTLFLIIVSLIIAQPDLGQAIVLSSIWFSQLLIAGLPLFFMAILIILFFIFIFISYLSFEHVRDRIDRWIDPSSGDTFQIQKSYDAFSEGGFFGVGPGQGYVKNVLPDAHSDFIFSIVGEEFGFIGAVLLLWLFGYIITRILRRAGALDDLFTMIATIGLCVQFTAQVAINTGSSVGLIPSKGMTLPFISYGGSSLVSMGILMGVILSFTRKRKD